MTVSACTLYGVRALDKARADPKLAKQLVDAQVDVVNAALALHGIPPGDVLDGVVRWELRYPDLKSEERVLVRRKQRLGMVRIEVGEGDTVSVTRTTYPPDDKEATPW